MQFAQVFLSLMVSWCHMGMAILALVNIHTFSGIQVAEAKSDACLIIASHKDKAVPFSVTSMNQSIRCFVCDEM